MKRKSTLFLFFSCFILFVSLSLLLLQKWATERFPMDDALAVYYTLQNAPSNFDPSIITEGVFRVCISLLISVAFFFVLFFYKKNVEVNQFEKLSKSLFFISLAFLIFALSLSFKNLHAKDYISIFKTNEKNVPYFTENDYKKAELQNIIFPSQKRNLIILFLESTESSFASFEEGGFQEENLIGELTSLAKEHIHFSDSKKIGGGFDLPRTNWTCAALIAKLFGIPFVTSPDNSKSKMSACSFTSITDILSANGYNQLFICGSDKKFASRDVLFENHGNVKVHDINWYKENNFLPKDYHVFWGFEDEKLFSFAKKELETLSEKDEPFMFSLLTVDTHMPYGYECACCKKTYENSLKNAIRCSSIQTANFIEWCKAQAWYKNTTIVLLGDHLFMDTAKTKLFKEREKIKQKRRFFNTFINVPFKAEDSVLENRLFSSFDMAPTILSSIGCIIEDEQFALGVNLFSSKKTLLEKYGTDEVSKKLRNF